MQSRFHGGMNVIGFPGIKGNMQGDHIMRLDPVIDPQ